MSGSNMPSRMNALNELRDTIERLEARLTQLRALHGHLAQVGPEPGTPAEEALWNLLIDQRHR